MASSGVAGSRESSTSESSSSRHSWTQKIFREQIKISACGKIFVSVNDKNI